MKKYIISIALLLVSFLISAQTKVKKDITGNYVAVQVQDSTTYDKTKEVFADKKGIQYPIYITKKGKHFINVTSKKGTAYRKYLDFIG